MQLPHPAVERQVPAAAVRDSFALGCGNHTVEVAGSGQGNSAGGLIWRSGRHGLGAARQSMQLELSAARMRWQALGGRYRWGQK